MARPRIDFIFFDAGGGHRSAATALQAMVEQQQRPWDVRLVDLNDILLQTDIFKKLTGYGLEDLYNLVLSRGWTLGSTQLLPVMQFVIRLFHGTEVRLIEEFWRKDTPDLAVSLIPNFNRPMFQALRRINSTTPYVNILTDFADYPPHMWIERGQRQYFICGTAKAVAQALAAGNPPERVFATSGMILRPSFYETPPIDRAAERAKLGLTPDLPTGMVLFGGHGPPMIEKIYNYLSGLRGKLQLIVICGHNESLATKLRARTELAAHVVGFTREVPRFMQMADFMIGKPGPGSISEAIQMGLPVIVERNAWTMPQERYNAEWVVERGVGQSLTSFRHIRRAVEELLAPGQLDAYRQRVAQVHNRAVFEIPDLLQNLLP